MSYSNYFNPELETMPREELRKLQLERLQKTVRQCAKAPFYQDKFKEMGIQPEDIKSLDDLQKLPFTTKDDLRDYYPWGLTAVPLKECVRLHSCTHRKTSMSGQMLWLAVCGWWDAVLRMCSRIPLAMVCSPQDSVSSMELSA